MFPKPRFFNCCTSWKGQPLVSLDVIIHLLAHTTSSTGLKVYTIEDHNTYPTKRKISNEQLDSRNIVRNDLLGKWNDTIKPK